LLALDVRIVGIGASAGGIEALEGFFKHMPAGNGLAFLIVMHLAPDRVSMLAEVLGRWTDMTVAQAVDGVAIAAEHVYVIPPNMLMTVAGGRLHLRTPSTPMRENAPIDILFTSMAAERGSRAIGVVLSGTGSDGSLGLKAIKQAGGVSLVQGGDHTGPQYSGMPSSAIATGAADMILPVEEMPERILHLEARPDPPLEEAGTPEQLQIAAARSELCLVLRNQIGHDFSGYKEQTFVRRVQRRMQFLGLNLPAYLRRLRADQHEVLLLFQDLLIGVTSFFRDPETFEVLAQTVIPRLFEGKFADSTVRVWVPGCATGEEAYSLAILLREHMATLATPPKLQIFATDIDEPAIALARTGRYPALLLKDVSPERLERFFIVSDDMYQIRKEVRDLCTFSAHSVIRDPPFSRIDLISCRNLLIYLDATLQAWVVPAFHYSLVPGGFLLLGGSEMVTRHGELFTSIDKKHRIFQRRDGPSPPLELSHVMTAGRHVSLPPSRSQDSAADWSDVARRASERILARHAPPFVVVNADGVVLHFSSRTGKYLEPAPGVPTRDIVAMARRGLRLELRTALRKALETGQRVERGPLNIELDGGNQPVTLTIEPLPARSGERLFVVVFGDLGDAPPRQPETGERHPSQDGVEQLERELSDAREQLQSITEEYETALEELKSGNEELQSVNEELQSTNEELETSKEEIQSMNEELQTVNAQLTAKLDELNRANSDLRNLFESTQVATVFIDRFLVIRSFTPAVAGIYNLIPGDIGRPLSDIVSQIDDPSLKDDIRTVLDTLEPFERRVARRDNGAYYLMRILPYRGMDNQVDGALITYVDVTSVVQAEQHHRMMVDELNHRVRNMLTVVISLASQTLRRSTTLEEFADAFNGRMNALAATYTLLSRDQWRDVLLRDVLTEELRPFVMQDSHRIELSGPSLFLKPRVALALGMIIHELVTNATKYGALSVPEGRVILAWAIDLQEPRHRLTVRWQERDGPPVAKPGHSGFGLSLIERSMKHELNGETTMEFDPAGLSLTLSMPFTPTGARRDDGG
jgi:two-component system CheB/CheR fusion protein